jgi:hypothetical protein
MKIGVTPDATLDPIARILHADPAKLLVMTYFRQLVADGHAQWHRLASGDIQLRLHSGETYLLAKTTITRIA